MARRSCDVLQWLKGAGVDTESPWPKVCPVSQSPVLEYRYMYLGKQGSLSLTLQWCLVYLGICLTVRYIVLLG